jgi:hypothetical protein
LELIEIDRLGQVGAETGLTRTPNVLVLAIAGQRDCRENIAAGSYMSQQSMPFPSAGPNR